MESISLLPLALAAAILLASSTSKIPFAASTSHSSSPFFPLEAELQNDDDDDDNHGVSSDSLGHNVKV